VSKADGQRHLRRLRCDGCYRRCQYSKFKVRPGERGGDLYTDVVESLTVEEDNTEKWRYKRRGTVLGMLHAEKREAWEAFTEGCPRQGEWLKLDDVVTWTTTRGTVHRGELVFEVDAGVNGRTLAVELGLARSYYLMLDRRGAVRDHQSFLVECEKMRDGKPILVWPYVERLERVSDPPF
jgi:hypothetical protein